MTIGAISVDSSTLAIWEGEEESVQGPNIGTYQEMTQRIPQEELQKIEEKMALLQDVQTTTAEIKNLLVKGQYQDLCPDAFYYALRGLKEGSISSKEACRISDIETLRMQGVSFEVFDPIERFGEDIEVLKDYLHIATGKHLHGEKLEGFLHALKALPQQDRYMMVFKPKHQKMNFMTLALKLNTPKQVTISQVVETQQKMNIFNRIKGEDRSYLRLSASLELFSLVVQHCFGEDAVTPNPVFGISTPSQIERNGLTSTRDVCCLYLVPNDDGTSALKTYEEADGYPCEENDFNFHDRYHTFVTSAVGKRGRQISVTVAQKLKSYALAHKASLSKPDYAAMRNMRWQFIDMDYANSYKPHWGIQNRKAGFETLVPLSQNNQKLPLFKLIDGMFQFFAVEQQLVGKPEALPSGNPIKVFDTEQDLEEIFTFVANSLPDTPELNQARNRYVEVMEEGLEKVKEAKGQAGFFARVQLRELEKQQTRLLESSSVRALRC